MRFKSLAMLFLPTTLMIPAMLAMAQDKRIGAPPGPLELDLGYSYLRTNAPPGGCGCFSLNGGSLGLAWPVARNRFAMAAEMNIVNQPDALKAGNSLTLSTYLAGARYRPLTKGRWQPWVEAMIGAALASGTLTTASGAGTPSAAFAAQAGGGLDMGLNKRLALRLVRIDYLPTVFNNGSNDHQNNLRLGAGVILRF